ncbi:MAG: hypothetical protein J6O73_14915 [Lachnospiraceae bacterium]|nr:hypothetical protein [Lachnospiraceae bacterium]
MQKLIYLEGAGGDETVDAKFDVRIINERISWSRQNYELYLKKVLK